MSTDDIEKALKAGALDLSTYEIADVNLEGLYRAHCQGSSLLAKAGLNDAVLDGFTLDGDLLSLPLEFANPYVAGDVADFIRRRLLAAGATFTFETVMSDPRKLDFMLEALAHGYRTYLYFVATASPDINVDRVNSRYLAGGHSVPEKFIVKRYHASLKLLAQACSVATRSYVFDNSGDGPVLVAEVDEEGNINFPVNPVPAWVVGAGLVPEGL
jgi:predicted ABC-type ATPase